MAFVNTGDIWCDRGQIIVACSPSTDSWAWCRSFRLWLPRTIFSVAKIKIIVLLFNLVIIYNTELCKIFSYMKPQKKMSGFFYLAVSAKCRATFPEL